MARMALLMTATIHVAGKIVDESDAGYTLDDASLVFNTGEFPKCLKSGGTWSASEKTANGHFVLRGAVVHIIPLTEK